MEIVTGDGATAAALLLFRLTGVVMVAPVFSARVVPMQVRTALLALLVVLLWPAASAALPVGRGLDAPGVLTEALVGTVIGLGAAILIAAAESAGDMLAVQMGLSGANILDPMSQTQMPVLGQLLGLTALTMLVSLGGHVLILETLVESFRIVPPGGVIEPTGGVGAVTGVGTTLFATGLRLAAPVVAAMMIANAALGVIARTVPQLNVLMVAFPVQIALGLFVLGVSLPLMATVLAGWGEGYLDLTGGLLGGLLPAGGR